MELAQEIAALDALRKKVAWPTGGLSLTELAQGAMIMRADALDALRSGPTVTARRLASKALACKLAFFVRSRRGMA